MAANRSRTRHRSNFVRCHTAIGLQVGRCRPRSKKRGGIIAWTGPAHALARKARRRGEAAVGCLLGSFALAACDDSKSAAQDRILGDLAAGRSVSLARAEPASQSCVFPAGTVLPIGEALHLFPGSKVTVAGFYNSSDVWFVFLANVEGNNVLLIPVRQDRLSLRSEEMQCGPNLTLDPASGGIDFRNGEAKP